MCGRSLVLRRRRARWQARAREARVFSCARFRRRLGSVFGRDFVCDFVCDFVRRGEQNVHTRSPNAYIGDRDITARRNHRRHHRRDLDGAREQKGQERSKCGRAPEQGTEQNPRGARSRAAPECARLCQGALGPGRRRPYKTSDSDARASREEPYDLEGSARLDVSDRRIPRDRPWAISRNPMIWKSRPGSTSQIVGLLAISLCQSRGAPRPGRVGPARCLRS